MLTLFPDTLAHRDCEPEYNPDDPRVVTDVWLEACLFHEKIMEEHDNEMVNVMRRPLRFSCPIPRAPHSDGVWRGLTRAADSSSRVTTTAHPSNDAPQVPKTT